MRHREQKQDQHQHMRKALMSNTVDPCLMRAEPVPKPMRTPKPSNCDDNDTVLNLSHILPIFLTCSISLRLCLVRYFSLGVFFHPRSLFYRALFVSCLSELPHLTVFSSFLINAWRDVDPRWRLFRHKCYLREPHKFMSQTWSSGKLKIMRRKTYIKSRSWLLQR